MNTDEILTRCRTLVRQGGEVDDVIQETLLRAARYRGSLADPARLRGLGWRHEPVWVWIRVRPN